MEHEREKVDRGGSEVHRAFHRAFLARRGRFTELNFRQRWRRGGRKRGVEEDPPDHAEHDRGEETVMSDYYHIWTYVL